MDRNDVHRVVNNKRPPSTLNNDDAGSTGREPMLTKRRCFQYGSKDNGAQVPTTPHRTPPDALRTVLQTIGIDTLAIDVITMIYRISDYKTLTTHAELTAGGTTLDYLSHDEARSLYKLHVFAKHYNGPRNDTMFTHFPLHEYFQYNTTPPPPPRLGDIAQDTEDNASSSSYQHTTDNDSGASDQQNNTCPRRSQILQALQTAINIRPPETNTNSDNAQFMEYFIILAGCTLANLDTNTNIDLTGPHLPSKELSSKECNIVAQQITSTQLINYPYHNNTHTFQDATCHAFDRRHIGNWITNARANTETLSNVYRDCLTNLLPPTAPTH